LFFQRDDATVATAEGADAEVVGEVSEARRIIASCRCPVAMVTLAHSGARAA